jgi:cytochrome c
MIKFTMLLITCFSATAAFADHPGVVSKGERVFRKCRSCHEVGEGAKYKVGPALNGLLGQKAGALSGDKASRALRQAGEQGMVWDADTLYLFLKNPKKLIPKTRMSFSGLKRHEDRGNIIAYFTNLGHGEVPVAKDPEVPADILAIEGDLEYGEYLAASCTACHQSDGSEQGLPSIVGWPTNIFVTAMHAYKVKVRENPVMQQQAGALNNEEIAALAAYFAAIK